jgi:transcriptional regulator with XRE-family HTH domain
MKPLGKKIKEARLMKDICQEYMAVQLGITQAAYSKIENGQTQITVVRLLNICRILEIDPKVAIEEQEEPEEEIRKIGVN